MNWLGRMVVLVSAVGLVACASKPQAPVQMESGGAGLQGQKVGVLMTALPINDTHLPGADCLLCIGVASLANSSLTAHAKTLSREDLLELKGAMGDALRKKGADVVVIDESPKLETFPDSGSKAPNTAPKNFASLQQKYKLDKLLVIEVTTLGFWRTYASYIPTSDPKAVLKGRGYLVNLTSHAYEWYAPVEAMKSADGAWDESPKYPGLTNAYYQVLEQGKDDFLKSFVN